MEIDSSVRNIKIELYNLFLRFKNQVDNSKCSYHVPYSSYPALRTRGCRHVKPISEDNRTNDEGKVEGE